MNAPFLHSLPVLQFGPLMDSIQLHAIIAKEAHAHGEFNAASDALKAVLSNALSGQHMLTGLRK